MISGEHSDRDHRPRLKSDVNRVMRPRRRPRSVGAVSRRKHLKLKSVYIIHDKTLYGQGVAETFFANEARSLA